jgi:hypothetical protein
MNEHIEIEIALLLYFGFVIFCFMVVAFVNHRWPNFFVDNSNNQDPPVIPPA